MHWIALIKEHLAPDKFYSQLRLKSVKHLGQLNCVNLETTGDISIFYKNDDKVGYGLPIRPELFQLCFNQLTKKVHYSCVFRGYSQYIETINNSCERCSKDVRVKSIKTIRIA